jgi:hypothetical protein
MIDPREIKIGNLLYDDSTLVCKVIGLTPFCHSVRCDESGGCDVLIDLYLNTGEIKKGYTCDSNLMNYIPITEEWLIKLGFEKHRDFENKDFRFYFMEDWDVALHPQEDLTYLCNSTSAYYSLAEIKYIHQLQNLYFALAGQELTIQ